MKIYPEGYQGTSIKIYVEVDGNLYAVNELCFGQTVVCNSEDGYHGQYLKQKEYQDTEYII